MVVNHLRCEVRAGDHFLFVNRRRTSCKILFYDGTGLCILMKRLDKGRFARLWRPDAERGRVELKPSELALYLEGCELVGFHRLAP